tara:strand:- start:1578 stop:2051 length:474 start_codon:yes stop_codon:yes gene_type:complete
MSTLRVDNLQGQTADDTNRYVVQVVEFTEATNYSTTSTNTDVQGPQTGTFTLLNPSNKVLVTATFLGNTTLSSNYNGARFSLYRGAISGGTRITAGTEPQILTYSTDMWTWVCLQKLDTPGGNTTYSIGLNKHSNAGQANIKGSYGNTVITMMEIAQ